MPEDVKVIAAVAVIALVVGIGIGYAIGGAGGQAQQAANATATQAPTQAATGVCPGAPDKVRIALVYFFSGAFGTYGDMAGKAVDIAVEEINGAGGILGVPIEIIKVDEADRQRVIDNVRAAVQQQGAQFIVGIDSSGDSLKLAPIIEEELKVPTIVTHAATPKLLLEKREYIFRISLYEEPIIKAAAKIIAELAEREGLKKVGFIGPDYAYGYDSYALLKAYLQEYKPDLEVMDPIYTPLGTTDFGAAIDTFIAEKPDVIYSALWGGDAATFFKQAKAKGLWKVVKYYFNAMLGATDTLQAIGDENLPDPNAGEITVVYGSTRYWFNYPPHDVNPVNKRFVEKFYQKYGTYPAYVSGTAYTAIYAIKAAIEKACAENGRWPTPEEFVKALEDMSVTGPMGAVYIRGEDHQGLYYVLWGKLTAGGPLGYPFPVLTDFIVFEPHEVYPPPFQSKLPQS